MLAGCDTGAEVVCAEVDGAAASGGEEELTLTADG